MSICAFFLFGSALGQVGCVEDVRKATDLCLTAGSTCTVNDIISRAENFALNPAHKICLDKTGYFLALADFCAVSVNVPGSSPHEVIHALDKAILFVAKAGEMKPELILAGGSGALKMIELYDYQSQIYLQLNDLTNYQSAIEKREFWEGEFNGVESEKPEPVYSPDKKKDTLSRQTPVIDQPELKNYIIKPLVVVTNSQRDQALLTNVKLKVSAEPPLELIPSEHPERFSYSLSFEEGVTYKVTLSHPEFEEQFFLSIRPVRCLNATPFVARCMCTVLPVFIQDTASGHL